MVSPLRTPREPGLRLERSSCRACTRKRSAGYGAARHTASGIADARLHDAGRDGGPGRRRARPRRAAGRSGSRRSARTRCRAGPRGSRPPGDPAIRWTGRAETRRPAGSRRAIQSSSPSRRRADGSPHCGERRQPPQPRPRATASSPPARPARAARAAPAPAAPRRAPAAGASESSATPGSSARPIR